MPPTLVDFIGCIAASILLSAVYTYLARLVWHPLAKFPGPKLAGASRLYEVYHQVYKSDWLENLSALHDKYGPLIRIGPNELHSIDNQWNLQHHRRRDLKKCTDYYGVLDTVLGGFQQPHHHAARGSIVRPLFTGSILAEFSDGPLNDLTEKLLRRMTSVAEKNSKLDATHLIWAFTTDAMLLYVLGENSRYLDMEDIENFHDGTRALSVIDYATVLRTMPLVNLVINYFPALKGLSVHSWIEKRVRTHLHLNEEKRLYGDNILGRLRSRLDDETAIQEAAQAIFIGNESMLSNLTFIIHHLIHNPESVHRLRQELYAADATESPNATAGQGQDPIWRHSRVAQLPYLDAVLRESTRLSAPAWHRQPRAIDEVLEYDNKEIPPMTSFSFTLRLLERDPARYSDPDKFVPERWLGATKETQDLKQMSATFGTGSRMCLGQHIARQVLRKTIACLVYHFDFALWDPQKDHAENYRYMATFPQKGKEGTLQLCLKPRL